MQKRILGAITVAGLTLLAACSGGNSNTITPPANKSPQTPSKAATATMTIQIPLGSPSFATTASHGRAAAQSAHPMYLDGSSNGMINVYFDGTPVVADFSTQGGTVGAGPSGHSDLANGGSFNYNSNIAQVGNQLVATINANYSTTPGLHTIGAVQTNGACTSGQCISGNNGYVLAEGQITPTLQPGSNNVTALYLKGVMESAYLCDYAADGVTPLCDGSAGPIDSNGNYHIYTVVADENGTAITHQVDAGGNVVSFDNGSYVVQETDGNNIVSIDKPGPYSSPGTDRHASYGVNMTIHCNKAGTATLATALIAGGPSRPTVSGFTAVSGDYPTPGSILSATGSNISYGNQLTVDCNTASGSLTIQ